MSEIFTVAWDFFQRGGPVMYLLAIFSVAALAVTIERILYLRMDRVVPDRFLTQFRSAMVDGQVKEAMTLCKFDGSNVARILYEGLKKIEKGASAVAKSMESAGKSEALKLERYINVVYTVAAVSPLLGLLGTVTGMIKAFQVIQSQGLGDPSGLAGGISEALITTATGLIVAIPYFIAARYFTSKVNYLTFRMEEEAEHLLESVPLVSEQQT